MVWYIFVWLDSRKLSFLYFEGWFCIKLSGFSSVGESCTTAKFVLSLLTEKKKKKYITMCLHDYIFHEYTSQVSLVSSIQSHFIALEFISSCLWFQISDWNSYSSMTKPRQHPCYHYLPPPLVHYLYQRTCGQELDEKGNIGRLRREAISAVSPFSSFDSD